MILSLKGGGGGVVKSLRTNQKTVIELKRTIMMFKTQVYRGTIEKQAFICLQANVTTLLFCEK